MADLIDAIVGIGIALILAIVIIYTVRRLGPEKQSTSQLKSKIKELTTKNDVLESALETIQEDAIATRATTMETFPDIVLSTIKEKSAKLKELNK